MEETQLKYGSGQPLSVDDVLWNGRQHHSVGHHEKDGYYLICCDGYTHNLTQEILNEFTYVGRHQDCLHLLKCD